MDNATGAQPGTGKAEPTGAGDLVQINVSYLFEYTAVTVQALVLACAFNSVETQHMH